MAAPTSLDLFSGAAGAWTLGLHRAGFRTVAACEADPWRRAAFATNWPEVRLYDDIRFLSGDAIRRDVGAVDIVCGSPPCQDASRANPARRGLDGARTGLFGQAVRLVRELRPRWVAFENVDGIQDFSLDRISGGLEEAGYRVEIRDMGHDDMAASCIRRRTFFLGWRRDAYESDCVAEFRPAAVRRRGAPSTPSGAEEIPLRSFGQSRRAASADAGAYEGVQHVLALDGRQMARRARLVRHGQRAQETHWRGDYVKAARRHLRMATRLPAGLAGKIAESYGDAISPELAELIGLEFLEAPL